MNSFVCTFRLGGDRKIQHSGNIRCNEINTKTLNRVSYSFVPVNHIAIIHSRAQTHISSFVHQCFCNAMLPSGIKHQFIANPKIAVKKQNLAKQIQFYFCTMRQFKICNNNKKLNNYMQL